MLPQGEVLCTDHGKICSCLSPQDLPPLWSGCNQGNALLNGLIQNSPSLAVCNIVEDAFEVACDGN